MKTGKKEERADKPDISLFFPAFNEEANIERVTLAAREVLQRVANQFEIIIVNDGSSDATAKIAERLSSEDPRILVCHHEVNRGYGAALRTGYDAAHYPYIFFTDSDGQFDLSEIELFLPYIGSYHIVTGFRLKRRDPFIRSINAYGWNILNRLLLGVRVKDINCAFKCVQKTIFDEITLTTDGAMINAELYAKARIFGKTIKEVGVHHYPRRAGTQTGANPKVILKAFKELLRIKREINAMKKG